MFTQAEVDAASHDKTGAAMTALLQREKDNGFATSLPDGYELGPDGQVQVKPQSWMAKYGWMLPAAAMSGGALAAFSGGGAAVGGAGSSVGASLGPVGPGVLAPGAGAAATAGSGVLAPAAGGGSSLWSTIGGHLKDIGGAIGKAGTASGNNRLSQETLAMQANRDNIAGNTASENAAIARAKLEATERRSSLIDVARASDTRNPNRSPFDTAAPKTYSPDYMSSLTALEKAGLSRLQADPTYSTNKMAPLRTYQPLDITNMPGATNTNPSLLERIGQYAGPALSLFGK